MRMPEKRFIVEYPDGMRSRKMYQHTADSYAHIFGGRVICVIPKKTLLFRLKKLFRPLYNLLTAIEEGRARITIDPKEK